MPAEIETSPARVERRLVDRPFFSVCIPQHNRTSFLIEVCRSLAAQRFREFEVCISDDCSTDGRTAELLEYLQSSGLSFVYRRLPGNVRYDGNLRSAIDLATGQFCFLLGNDDALADADTLAQVYRGLVAAEPAAVVFTNFADYATGRVSRRVGRTAMVGAGPMVAAARFRKFSFVSGILLRRDVAQAAATTRWDGSEMYQMYVGSRLIAAGGRLAELDLVAVRKDIEIPGEAVDSYAKRQRVRVAGIPAQQIPLTSVARLMIDAIEPHLGRWRLRPIGAILVQYFGLLHPYWLLEYRRVQSWRYAAGVARAMRPGRTLDGCRLSALERSLAAVVYFVTTVAGLVAPVGALRLLQRPARSVARLVGDWSATASRP
jgi:glycosyltransferase involved in cell wall biosynthesis